MDRLQALLELRFKMAESITKMQLALQLTQSHIDQIIGPDCSCNGPLLRPRGYDLEQIRLLSVEMGEPQSQDPEKAETVVAPGES